MQVILTEDVPDLGDMGDIVDVADGFGRNYLIPQQLAVQATRGNRRQFDHLKRQIDKKSAQLRKKALTEQGILDGVSVTIAKRTADSDKLYGSVTNREVAAALEALGYGVERRQIQVDQPIHELGIYECSVRLHSDVVANIRVWVVRM